MIAPAVLPLSRRMAPSTARFGASAAAEAVRAHRKVAMTTTKYLPNRSPSGPTKTWHSPYETVKAVATTEALPAVTPNSATSCGMSGSATRNVADDAKAATLRRAIGRIDGAGCAGGGNIGGMYIGCPTARARESRRLAMAIAFG